MFIRDVNVLTEELQPYCLSLSTKSKGEAVSNDGFGQHFVAEEQNLVH